MTKTDVKRDLLNYNNGRPFVSVTELASALHIGKDSARRWVEGLDYIRQGKRKDYLVEDVAARLAESRRV